MHGKESPQQTLQALQAVRLVSFDSTGIVCRAHRQVWYVGPTDRAEDLHRGSTRFNGDSSGAQADGESQVSTYLTVTGGPKRTAIGAIGPSYL